MNDQLVTINDETLDHVAGGATVDVSLSFPTPFTLIKGIFQGFKDFFSAIRESLGSVRGLFGIDITVK